MSGFRTFLLFQAVAIAIWLLCLVAVSSVDASYESNRINALASWLAQRPVGVKCLSEKETKEDTVIYVFGAYAYVNGWRDENYAWHPFSTAVFAFGLCESLLAFPSGRKTNDEYALAILILTHEAGHLRGHRWSADEQKTECWAIRHFKYVAARMGVEPGSYYMSLLYAKALAFHNSLPPQYHGGCVVPAA